MKVTVTSRFQRSAPRKARLVVGPLKGLHTDRAFGYLNAVQNACAPIIIRTLKAALALAKEREMDLEQTVVSQVTVDEGPKFKRRILFSRGRSAPMVKQLSHILIELSDESDTNTGKSATIQDK